jgi:1-acyl-sn-glycerol-3-phosphate acyltransferase
MLQFLLATLTGLMSTAFLVLHTLFLTLPLYLLFILKCISPNHRWRDACQTGLNYIGDSWTATNKRWIFWLYGKDIEVSGLPKLNRNDWHFIICNHQSWTDILILQSIFSKKIPFIKFFTKDVLKYFPLLGIGFLVFEFPTMKRYPAKILAKKPHLRGQDLQKTIKLCQRYTQQPSSILNFIEGTRFTQFKKAQQSSPYQHLLIPKTGGFAITIQAMQPKIKKIINVVIAYPNVTNNFWRFLCGRIRPIKVKIEVIKIPEHLLNGNYLQDNAYKSQLKAWLASIWRNNDQLLSSIQASSK